MKIDGLLESFILDKYDMAISPIASTKGLMSKNDRYVVRHGDDWAVKKGGAERASSIHGTQRERSTPPRRRCAASAAARSASRGRTVAGATRIQCRPATIRSRRGTASNKRERRAKH
jgi:Uncharacterized protein conserved in bacteria (DUF2188)